MDKFKYYLKKYQFLIYLIGLGLAIIGSIEVFWGQYDNIFKQLGIILFSIVKLFLFQPLQSVTNVNNPVTYDLAILIAPIGTVVGLLSVFDTLYQNTRLRLLHFGKRHLVVMGTNENAQLFMNNAKREYRILCLATHDTSQSLIDTLNRENILVALFDYNQGASFENKKTYQHHKINKAISIVSFEEEPMNYGYLEVIDKLQQDYPEVLDVFVHHQNTQLKEVIQKPLDNLKKLDFRYFNIEMLMSFDLFNQDEFKLKDLSELNNADINNKEDLDNKTGRVHLLLIGFSHLGQSLFRGASNQATINPVQNMRVTLVGKNVKTEFDQFDSQFVHLDKVADFTLIEQSINSKLTQSMLQKINETEPFTSVIFTLNDAQESLLSLERLSKIIYGVPIAIYARNMTSIKPLAEAMLTKHPLLVFFGELNDILTPTKIMAEDNYLKAKQFNAYYNQVAAQWMGYSQSDDSITQQWQSISNVKKESSYYQTLHQRIKRKILSELPVNESILTEFKQMLENKSLEEQTQIIQDHSLMNYLSALEHKRWNNFYYMQDFDYADQTNELLKTHNCLIDDWELFFSIRRDKVIYDLLSWLSLDGQTE